MNITIKRTVNLSEPVLPEVLSAPLYEGEKNAHTFMITAEKDKLPHALSGSVVAYFERSDGNTVRVEGETLDGCAILTLSPECYQTGVFYLAVMLISDGAQTVIYAASGRVRNTQDGEIIDGGNTIPTYDEIMTHLNKYLSTDITAKVEETEDGALITMKDVVNGETTAVVKNGKPGAAGDTGATFRPAVSENGILSWTNDKNLENPEPVCIKGPEGDPGENGISPTAKVKETAEGAELTVTDAEGVTKAVIKHGKDGYTPQKGIDYFDGKPGENGYTPVKGVDYFDGKNGEPGEPGFSPTAKVTQTADGARIDITDKSGTTSAIVKNGKDGADAEGGSNIPTAGRVHQMLVTNQGGDMKWVDRTHYAYEEMGDVVPETAFTASDVTEFGIVIKHRAILENGKTYTVLYNGKEYPCMAIEVQAKTVLENFGVSVPDDVMGGILGNMGFLNPSLATSEPFILMMFQGVDLGNGTGEYGYIIPLDNATSGSFAIRGMVKKYKTIDPEYLPESVKGGTGTRKQITIFRNTALDEGELTADTPFSEAIKMTDAELMASIIVKSRNDPLNASASVVSVSRFVMPDTQDDVTTLNIIVNDVYDGTEGVKQQTRILWFGTGTEDHLLSSVENFADYRYIAPLIPKDNSLTVDTLRRLSVSTMSETVKGGAKVGEGLEVVDDTLRVKPEGEYELIETITLNAATTSIVRSEYPNGEKYNLKEAVVTIISQGSGNTSAAKFGPYIKAYVNDTENLRVYLASLFTTYKSMASCYFYTRGGYLYCDGFLPSTSYDNVGAAFASNVAAINKIKYSPIKKLELIVVLPNSLPTGTVVEIWGVRADA